MSVKTTTGVNAPPATASPTDPPKRRDPHARQREYNAAHALRMIALWRGGMSLPEIAKALDDEGSRNSIGQPWRGRVVGNILLAHMDRAEYDALARAARAKGVRTIAARAAAAAAACDAAALPRAVALREDGLSLAGIAERLQAEGFPTSSGSRWSWWNVGALLRRHMPPAEAAALVPEPGKRKNALSARLRAKAEFEGALAPRVIAMWESDKSLAAIADWLKDEGVVDFQGNPWTPPNLSNFLKRHMGPAEHDARVAASPRVRGATNKLRTERHDREMLPRILELGGEGLTKDQVARRLNEEAGGDVARLNSRGKPWTAGIVCKVIRRSHVEPRPRSPKAPAGEHWATVAARLRREEAERAKAQAPEAVRWEFADLVILGDSHLVPPKVLGVERPRLTKGEFDAVREVREAGDNGIKGPDLEYRTSSTAVRMLRKLAKPDPDYWGAITVLNGRGRNDPIRFAAPGTF